MYSIERTYKAREDRIRELMIDKGLGIEALAKKAKSSVNTVKSMMNGGESFPRTFKKFADALGVKPSEIMDGMPAEPTADAQLESPPTPTNSGHRTQPTIIKLDDFSRIDETTDLISLLKAFANAIQAKGRIYVIDFGPDNSIRLTLDIDRDDANRLIAAFAAGKLNMLYVIRIIFPYSPEIRREARRPLRRHLLHRVAITTALWLCATFLTQLAWLGTLEIVPGDPIPLNAAVAAVICMAVSALSLRSLRAKPFRLSIDRKHTITLTRPLE